MTQIWKLYSIFKSFIKNKDIYIGQQMIKNENLKHEQKTEITNLCLDQLTMNLYIKGKKFDYECNLNDMTFIHAEPGKYIEIRNNIEKSNYKIMMN